MKSVHDSICMALYSLYCAEVPLRNCSLTRDVCAVAVMLQWIIRPQRGKVNCTSMHHLCQLLRPMLSEMDQNQNDMNDAENVSTLMMMLTIMVRPIRCLK